FPLALFLLVEILPIIHDAAHRRVCGGGDLNQVQVLFAGFLYRFEGRHDSQLLAFIINHADFACPNTLVGADKTLIDTVLRSTNRESGMENYSTRATSVELLACSKLTDHAARWKLTARGSSLFRTLPFRPPTARKSTAPEHRSIAGTPQVVPDDESYDSSRTRADMPPSASSSTPCHSSATTTASSGRHHLHWTGQRVPAEHSCRTSPQSLSLISATEAAA